MYARYIPPKKEAKKPEEPRASVAQQHPTNSSALYARYVPAPKPTAPQKRKLSFDNESNTPVWEQADAGSVAKRAKKSNTRLLSDVTTGDDVEPVNGERASEPTPAGPSEVRDRQEEKKGGKKHKKKKSKPELDFVETDAGGKAEDIASPVSTTQPTTKRRVRSEAEKKERKERKERKKLEKSKDSAVGANKVESSDPRTTKVLNKKQKSLQFVHQLAEPEPTERPLTVKIKEGDIIHGLEPLPQPDLVPETSEKPSYETLPPWLARPMRVSQGAHVPFSQLGVSPDYGIPAETERALEKRGWKEAFAIQAAVIPLLLPAPGRQGDVVITAATGSGKTLAYVLPMVRDISRGVQTQLRAIIVLPTRELAQQVAKVCESCAAAFASPNSKRVKVGISMGSQSFQTEQGVLMEDEQVYDPVGYQEYRRKLQSWPLDGSLEDGSNFRLFEKKTTPLPYHTIRHVSKVDILVCTPGRLVDHIKSTPGFTLDYVRWLVIDEADKLLGQSFQQWLEIVMGELGVERPGRRNFEDTHHSGVRKVVLSATMTRDLSLLNTLKLRRPKHIVLESTKVEGEQSTNVTEYALPESLEESSTKVYDESQKPLYLLVLLESHLKDIGGIHDEAKPSIDESIDDFKDRDHRSDNDEDESSFSSSEDTSPPASPSPSAYSTPAFPTTALIFTKSNESAVRLARLLALLRPGLEPHLGALTSLTRASERRRTIRDFASGRKRLIVATDLTARGLDLPGLDHVINYDVPPSVERYVHRVGRAARAGRPGRAWTLCTRPETGWFMPTIAGKGKNKNADAIIRRVGKVAQVSVERFSEEVVAEYEVALARLGEEATSQRKK
jgi:ATP-dependent RNA helicase DDX51/DBP6